MNTLRRFVYLLLTTLALLAGDASLDGGASAGPARATAPAGKYVCPPCNLPCDAKVFDAPGKCPECGMTLVPASEAPAAPSPSPSPSPAPAQEGRKVAVLVFPGVEIIDSMGPYEMFGAAGFDVYLVAATKDPVTTAMGVTVVPRYTFADAPGPDVLVVPGGGVTGASHSEAVLDYVRTVSAHTRCTMSVCNGAFILASAGLLDGLSATTTNGNLRRLERGYPKVRVVRDQRYVDNGRIVTTAGLSAGIDGALHVIARLDGTSNAQAVALAEEYDWKPEGGYARPALADQELPDIDMDAMGEWRVLRNEGDRSRWTVALTGTPKAAPADFTSQVEQALEHAGWKKGEVSSPAPAQPNTNWSFTGSDGSNWQGTLRLASDGGAGHAVGVELAIARTN